MSFGNLLTNDYQKSIKELLRFAIILGNLVLFYFFCGMRSLGRFGPKISGETPFAPWHDHALSEIDKSVILEDPMQYTSSLDMIAMILAVFVAMKQLTLGRPEIDSFNQIIYLLPQEKNSTLLLLLFTIYKTIFQYFYYIENNLGTDKTSFQQKYQSMALNRNWSIKAKSNPVNYFDCSTVTRLLSYTQLGSRTSF